MTAQRTPKDADTHAHTHTRLKIKGYAMHCLGANDAGIARDAHRGCVFFDLGKQRFA